MKKEYTDVEAEALDSILKTLDPEQLKVLKKPLIILVRKNMKKDLTLALY